jgi:phosphatidylserine/phosphatidylglycerophosphate/cardiolipin synthase-like enzyme
MVRKYSFIVACALLAMVVFGIVAREIHPPGREAASGGALSLVVEPDDGIAPVLAMIGGAKRSLDIVMYQLDDRRIEAALAADEARGVAVRVILNGGYKGAPPTAYTAAHDILIAHGVPVRWSPGYFSLTHEKSMVVDGNRALIMTFNWVSKYYATGRDFGVVDRDRNDVAAIERTFDIDWDSRGADDKDEGDDLLWSPGSERALLDLIGGATRSLFIYNEEMADMDIVKALIDAAGRGVAVYVVMTNSSAWKWQFSELSTAGVHVRTYADADDAPLYIHAKAIVADGVRAFVGSENFSKGSLDENRELGIITQDKDIIAGFTKIFSADWDDAVPFVVPKR